MNNGSQQSLAATMAHGINGHSSQNGNHNSPLPDSGFAFRLNEQQYGRDTATKDNVASFVHRWLDKAKDPAADVKGMPPLFGQDAIPHAMTFQSLIGSYAKTYLPSDESLEKNPYDAILMRKDLGIMECLEIRQRMTALLDWSIVPEDDKSPAQKSLAAELTKIVKRIKRFTEYRRCLMEGIWAGKSAIQHRPGYINIGGREYVGIKPMHADSTGWKHINGDKLVFRYDDGRKMEPGQYPDQMGIRVSAVIRKDSRFRGLRSPEPTNSGMALFLTPAERNWIICHKHMIEDAEYINPRKAGRIHGVGIRDRIYNEWFLKQETLGFLMEYLERSAGGIEIYEYPSGDEAAKQSIMTAAKERMAFGRNQIFFPKPLGMDGNPYDIRIVEPGFQGIDMLLQIQDKYFGHRIKRYIIGQTLSTEADATGLGSGVADLQKDSLGQIVRYDASNLEETISDETVRPLQLANYPETEQWQFSFKLEIESENAKETLDAYQAAWSMGAGIPEKDVCEAIGVSLDNPNEKVLRNQSAGAAPGMGMGNGMQFPPGTGFQSQVDKANDHVQNHAEIGKIKGAAADHVVGKVGGGKPPSSPAETPPGPPSTADMYEREFVESDHPRDDIGRFTSGEHGASFTSPELGKRNSFPMAIQDSDKIHAKVGNDWGHAKVPHESLHQLHSDLTGDMSYLKKFGSSGNDLVDAVVNGKGKMIGKGDDSVVFQVGDKIVKASTTVPYHPVGGGDHRTPQQAMNMAKGQFETSEKLRKMGIPGIPESQMVQHGDKVFTIRDNLSLGTPMNREQLQQVKDSVEKLHEAGYTINDQLQVGIGPDGKAYHFDLGKAEDGYGTDKKRSEMYDVEHLWKQNGETWRPSAKQAAEDFNTAKSLAEIDIQRKRPVREAFKKRLIEALDHLNHHNADEWWDNSEWMIDNGIDHYQRKSNRLLESAASTTNSNPSPSQISAGNYAKGIFPWRGLEIAIENPKGSQRKGRSKSGGYWSQVMACHYGYFRRTMGSDGDQLDVFIGNHPDSDYVLVIKQVDQDGKFDEFKVVIGCINRKQAKKLYLRNYPKGWKCGPAAGMTVESFKRWVEKGGPEKAKSLIKDEYARQLSLWDEEEHPRDAVGKFAEKEDSGSKSTKQEFRVLTQNESNDKIPVSAAGLSGGGESQKPKRTGIMTIKPERLKLYKLGPMRGGFSQIHSAVRVSRESLSGLPESFFPRAPKAGEHLVKLRIDRNGTPQEKGDILLSQDIVSKEIPELTGDWEFVIAKPAFRSGSEANFGWYRYALLKPAKSADAEKVREIVEERRRDVAERTMNS